MIFPIPRWYFASLAIVEADTRVALMAAFMAMRGARTPTMTACELYSFAVDEGIIFA